MREVPLESQVYAYWSACNDLRLARERGGDDQDSIEDIADLGGFTDHGPLRAACLSRLKCSVVALDAPLRRPSL